MKLHIVRPNQEAIENFTKAVAFENNINLTEVSDNECELIMANDIVDTFTIDKIGELVMSLRKKMRMNGKLVLGGTDIRLLCKAIVNDQISEQEGSNIISTLSSASNLTTLKAAVESVGLIVEATQISGIHYEVTAKRNA